MQRNGNSRLLPMLITLIVIILAVVLVVSIGRAIFFGAKQQAPTKTTDTSQTDLLNTDAGHSVRLTVRGPIVADENFKSYTIDVSPYSRSMSVYRGYLDSVEQSKSYDNNQKAYEEFVYALDKANMMKGAPSDDKKDDLRGICATGYMYDYSVMLNNQTTKHLWTSTCGGSKGTLVASVDQLNNLFQQQIVDYNTLMPFKQSSFGNLHL